ncbi:30S ribosomal protein S6 [uncultured Desulfatiglans sp.]|uniref:Small ribosomal subunit protein bS6 n=1 Tax=Uncultured Desulfatiglans sp. TaxID=1748965 RepID=A0A653A252_UNCDX|nr:30S ribosomal protein S6 [uncultured Desulfatiglans sp.]
MRYYETLYLINPDLAEEDYQSVSKKFVDIVGRHSGEVIEVQDWGRRPLAYDVKKFDKASFVLLRFCGENRVPEELQREMRLDDRVLKYQTVKLSEDADPEALRRQAEEARTKSQETPKSEAEEESESGKGEE